MKVITKEELTKKKEELKVLDENLNTLQHKIDELKDDEKVKEYITLDNEFEKTCNALGKLIEEIKYQDMYHCEHYFVLNEERREWDGHRTEIIPIVTCIHCGLTNKYYEFYMNRNFPQYNIVNEVYHNTNCRYEQIHGFYKYSEINDVKKIYDKFKEEYPDATDEDIENHIKLVKKMRGGKLC